MLRYFAMLFICMSCNAEGSKSDHPKASWSDIIRDVPRIMITSTADKAIDIIQKQYIHDTETRNLVTLYLTYTIRGIFRHCNPEAINPCVSKVLEKDLKEFGLLHHKYHQALSYCLTYNP